MALHYEREGTSAPRLRSLTRPIEEWLASLDPEEVLRVDSVGGYPTTRVAADGWALSLRAHGVQPRFRGRPYHRLIGTLGLGGGIVNDREQLGRALKRKKGGYGVPDRPLVIACLAINGFMDDLAVTSALFGSEAVSLNTATGEATFTRTPDGVWVGRRGASAKRMSALLMGTTIVPTSVATTAPRVWHHFAPTHPLDVELPLPTARVVDDERVDFQDARKPIHKVLELPADWPGPLFPEIS